MSSCYYITSITRTSILVLNYLVYVFICSILNHVRFGRKSNVRFELEHALRSGYVALKGVHTRSYSRGQRESVAL